MPIFEYRCGDCNTKFEVLHKSLSSKEKVACPECNSENSKKLFSSFSASMESLNSAYGSYDAAPDPGCSTCGCGGGTCGVE